MTDIANQTAVVGYVEELTFDHAQGWALDTEMPDHSVRVFADVEGEIVGEACALVYRSDISEASEYSGFQGFRIKFIRRLSTRELKKLRVLVGELGRSIPILDNSIAESAASERPGVRTYVGNLDYADRNVVRGWAACMENLAGSVEVNIFINGFYVGDAITSHERRDVAESIGGSGLYGFEFYIGFLSDELGQFVLTAKVGGQMIDIGPPLTVYRQLPGITHQSFAGNTERRILPSHPSSEMGDGNFRPQVAIIVLNRNGASHLEKLFKSFHSYNRYSSYKFLVVDHGSVDRSLEVIENASTYLNVSCVRETSNRSFSESNNKSALLSKDADVLLFLNNDIELVEDIISPLVQTLSDNSVGGVGVKLRLPSQSSHGSLTPTVHHHGVSFLRSSSKGRVLPYEIFRDFAGHASAGETTVPAVTGAALMVRKDDFVSVGGFNEGYYYGYEDIDLCLTLSLKLGKRIICDSSVEAIHDRGASRSLLSKEEKTAIDRNQDLFDFRVQKYVARQQNIQRFKVPSAKWSVLPRIAFACSEVSFDSTFGDFFTAYELGCALTESFSWVVSYLDPSQWYDLPDVDVLIAMTHDFDPSMILGRDRPLCVSWIRNSVELWGEHRNLKEFDLVMTSSLPSRTLLESITFAPAALLPLATNLQRFATSGIIDRDLDYVFVGNFFNAKRDIIDLDPASTPFEFHLFGHGWEVLPKFSASLRGPVSYGDVPLLYQRARIVIDDANHTTKAWGAMNSRVFDALAAGALVLTNNEIGSSEMFGSQLPVWRTAQELTDLIQSYLGNEEARADLVDRLRSIAIARHSYMHRAQSLQNALEQQSRTLIYDPVFVTLTTALVGNPLTVVLQKFLGQAGLRESPSPTSLDFGKLRGSDVFVSMVSADARPAIPQYAAPVTLLFDISEELKTYPPNAIVVRLYPVEEPEIDVFCVFPSALEARRSIRFSSGRVASFDEHALLGGLRTIADAVRARLEMAYDSYVESFLAAHDSTDKYLTV